MIDIINDLDNKFGLMKLFRGGIIPWTVLRDRDIYLQYDIYMKMGKKSMDSKYQTAEDFKVDVRTVERAIKKMIEINEKNSNPS
jgi:hypothetical protein